MNVRTRSRHPSGHWAVRGNALGGGVLVALVGFFGVGCVSVGCARQVSSQPVSSPERAASAVQLSAADLRTADGAPRVGKVQHAATSLVDDGKFEDEQRHRERPYRGGFSRHK
ncbi:MAG TPA: hypothetical protein VM580_28265 [Labilithrix sp.]|nr:hypothetical protein [Labilithrix sp.]